jgi:hypothetical protein
MTTKRRLTHLGYALLGTLALGGVAPSVALARITAGTTRLPNRVNRRRIRSGR